LSNQAYIGQQIGAFKVVALNHLISNKAQVDDASKLGWQFVNKKFVTLTRHPHHVLISAVDTRSGREELLLNGLSNACSLVVDCRMDAMQGSVMMYDPRNPAHRTNYMEHLPSEDYEGEVSACGLPVNCGSTSEFVSATAISLLLNWWESQIMENIHFNLRAMDFWRTPIAQQEAIS
jgi:hypothetical protein